MTGRALIKRAAVGSVLALAMVFAAGLVSAPVARADNFKGLTIAPASNQIELDKGETKTGTMRVTNSTDAKMTVKVDVAGYSIQNDNYNSPIYDSPSKYSVIKDWITLDKRNFVLEPGASETVTYTVKTPDNPPAGMQYATIMASNVPDKLEGSGISATTRVGLVLKAKMAGKTIDKSNIQNEKISGYQPGSSIKASFAIKNEGNIGADVRYSMTVKYAIGGAQAYQSGEQSNSVFPESTRPYSISWDQAKIGFYNVELNITINGRTHTTRHFVCTVPVWIFILVAIGIAALVAYVIINHRMMKETRAIRKSKKDAKRAGNSKSHADAEPPKYTISHNKNKGGK